MLDRLHCKFDCTYFHFNNMQFNVQRLGYFPQNTCGNLFQYGFGGCPAPIYHWLRHYVPSMLQQYWNYSLVLFTVKSKTKLRLKCFYIYKYKIMHTRSWALSHASVMARLVCDSKFTPYDSVSESDMVSFTWSPICTSYHTKITK